MHIHGYFSSYATEGVGFRSGYNDVALKCHPVVMLRLVNGFVFQFMLYRIKGAICEIYVQICVKKIDKLKVMKYQL